MKVSAITWTGGAKAGQLSARQILTSSTVRDKSQRREETLSNPLNESEVPGEKESVYDERQQREKHHLDHIPTEFSTAQLAVHSLSWVEKENRTTQVPTKAQMEPRKPPEYILEVFADPASVKDIVKGKALFFSFPSCSVPLRAIPCGWLGKNIFPYIIEKAGLTEERLHLGILHTIFFHRYFPSIRPANVDILDLTLPAINDVDLETLIDSRVTTLIRQHLSSSANSPNGGVRSRIAVQFFEKRRRKGGLWFGGKGEEEICWEIWTVDVTIATPRTETGMFYFFHLLAVFRLC